MLIIKEIAENVAASECVPAFEPVDVQRAKLNVNEGTLNSEKIGPADLGSENETLYFSDGNDSSTVLYAHATVASRLPVISLPADPVDIAAIIYARDAEQHLERCLDSILIQGGGSKEVIVIDDASCDATADLLARYAAQWPELRTVRLPERQGRGQALSLALHMATGQHVVFVECHEVLDAHFFEQGLALMAETGTETQPQILVCDAVTLDSPRGSVCYGLTSVVLAQEDALDAFLREALGELSLSAKMFKADFLRRHHVDFEGMAACEDVAFCIQAFYHAAAVRVDSCVALYRCASEATPHIVDVQGVEGFLHCIGFMGSFCTAHGLNAESPACAHAVRALYVQHREALCCHGGAELSAERLLTLGASPLLLRLLLADYANLVCHKNGLAPHVLPENADWHHEENTPPPPQSYAAYGRADAAKAQKPCLSVIIPNYNKSAYLRYCLNSVLRQSMQDFEIIIVDDASTDGSYDILCDYADKDPRIRLYRMDYNSLQGVCRNKGIELAQGEFITFVDLDDWLEPGFFAKGIYLARSEGADISIFDISASDEDPNFTNESLEVYRTGGTFATELLFKNRIPWGPYGKIFTTSFLNTAQIRFPEYIYHQDAVFLVDALNSSRSCVTSPECAYHVRIVPGSSCRPKYFTYRNLYTEWSFFVLWVNRNPQYVDHVRWTMETYLLPVLRAFHQASGEVPLPRASLAARQDALAMRTLFSGFVRAFSSQCDQQANLLQSQQSSVVPFVQTSEEAPLVSVIIPTYNQESCIHRCLDSVLASTLRNLEVIVVNDASTDRTLQICESYAKKDGRVRIFSNERNRGQGFSRNFAQEQVRSPYVTYVDSDDALVSDFLLYAVATMQRSPHVSWLKASHEDVLQGGNTQTVLFDDREYDGKAALHEMVADTLRLYTVWGALYRREFIHRHAICSPQHFFEDMLFLFKAMYCAESILLSSRVGYRRHVTPHVASTMNPVRQTYRHLSGILAHGKTKADFFAEHADVADLEKAAHGSTLWQFNRALAYIRECGDHLEALQSADLDNVRATPIFLRALMHAYAYLYIQDTGLCVAPPNAATDLPPAAVGEPSLRAFSFHQHKTIPRISIIIPAYKAEDYLAVCLDSVLAQAVDGLEILLIDDCSPDSTLSIALEYANTHACIRLYQTSRNCGQGIVRNLALREALGEYISFVDAADYLEPYFLQQGLREMQGDAECDMALFGHRREGGNNRSYTFPEARVSGIVALSDYCTDRIPHWYAWGIIYRKSFLTNHRLSFPDHLYEDDVFILDMYAAARWVRRVPQVGYVCRMSENSGMSRHGAAGQRHLRGVLAYLHYHTNFLKNHVHLGHLSADFDKRICNIWLHEFRSKVLPYAHGCATHGRPSPLTDEVLATLSKSDALLRFMVKDYVALYTKAEAAKNSRESRGQHSLHEQKVVSVPPQRRAAPAHEAGEAVPHLGMGSLFERLLWRIAPKRACIRALRRSGLVDTNYYRQTNPDVAQTGVDPAYHYVHFGAAEGRNPAPWFDTRSYVSNNPDVAASGANAFYHFLRYGHKEGRRPK